MKVTFTLNGLKTVCEISPSASLLETLREKGVSSVRSGCDTANCGICTVWVDDKPVLSCSYPAARAEERTVTTLEGIRAEAEPILKALAEEGADQCGFCSPGFIMTIAAMLRDHETMTDDEIRAYLSGNLCRCTGYMSQMRAIRKLFDERRAAK